MFTTASSRCAGLLQQPTRKIQGNSIGLRAAARARTAVQPRAALFPTSVPEMSLAAALGSELQMEATLHVSAFTAETCISEYGLLVAPQPSATDIDDSFAGEQDAAGSSWQGLGACLATPPELEEPEGLLRRKAPPPRPTVERIPARLLTRASATRELVRIADRYYDWVRRIRRRKRLEAVGLLMNLLSGPAYVSMRR